MTEAVNHDERARQQIKTAIDKNLFVEAGAGSGKTTSLVSRMAAMVKAGISVEKICAITFTKAAANEFYERFQAALSEEDDDRSRMALEKIDLAFMGTIDSFCQMVISEHPAEAAVPFDSEVIMDDDMEDIYKAEYTKILRGEYDDDYPHLRGLADEFVKVHRNSMDIFLVLLPYMLSHRDSEYMYTPVSPAFQGIGEFKELLKAIYANENLIDKKSKKPEAAYMSLMSSKSILLGKWDNRFPDVVKALKDIKALRISKDADASLLGPHFDSFLFPHEARGKISWYSFEDNFWLLGQLEEYTYSVTMEFAAAAAPAIAERLRKQGNLTYFDYLLYLRDMLKEDIKAGGKITRHIYDRHSYFLIDEFQDTNPMQAEIFFFLTAENPVADWKKCKPRPGSLFIVGDPKQSIYRFRSADVASFLEVKKLFTEGVGEVVGLTRNFRSSGDLCSWFNSVFTTLMPADTANQVKYEMIPPDPEKRDMDGEFHGVYTYPSFKEEDPWNVAKIITAIVHNPKYKVEGREIEYTDIMVITKAKGRMDGYIKAFYEADIPFRIEGKVLFGKCPALKAVAAAFAAAASEEKEYQFKAKEMGFDLASLKAIAYGRTPAALFTEIMDSQRIFERFGTEKLEYLYYALELLRESNNDNLKDASGFLSDLVTDNNSEERCLLLSRDTNRVHIANLHKVKGLEAPVVFLGDPSDSNVIPNERSHDGKYWLFNASKKFISYLTAPGFGEEKALEREALTAERERLLYVAATRAKQVLLIADNEGEKKGRNFWKPLVEMATGTLEIPEEDMVSVKRDTASAKEAFDDASAKKVTNTYSNRATYEIVRPSQIKVQSITDESEEEPEVKPEAGRENAALIGTMVHRLMEVLVSSGGWEGEDAKLVQAVSDEFPQAENEFLTDVLAAIRSGGYPQENGTVQDILGELLSAEKVYCEVPLCYMDGDSLWHGVIDVLYFKDGKWHILDYKTNADGSDLDTKYCEQLKAYIKAVKEIEGIEADARTYHINV